MEKVKETNEMRHEKTYISPAVKVRAIEMEDSLLAAASLTTGSTKSLTVVNPDGYQNGFITSDDIGAKGDNTSGGWDDWDEDGD